MDGAYKKIFNTGLGNDIGSYILLYYRVSDSVNIITAPQKKKSKKNLVSTLPVNKHGTY